MSQLLLFRSVYIDVLQQEEKLGMEGLLAEVRQYSSEWKVPDLTSIQILKKTLDSTAKRHFMYEMWRSLWSSKKISVRMAPEKTSSRAYFTFSRLESKLMLARNVGELNLLTNRKGEYLKKLGSTECLVRVCGGEDDLNHISECFGYSTKPEGDGGEKSQAEYLVRLNKERISKYRFPLIHFKS